MSPAEKVLDVGELFEAIAIHMPAAQLLAFRRVSKQWRVSIDGSAPLLRKLFLLPIKTDQFATVDERFLLATSQWAVPTGYDDSDPVEGVPVVLNEGLFRKSLDKCKDYYQQTPDDVYVYRIFQGRTSSLLEFKFDIMSLKEHHKAFNMFLTQPPIKRIIMYACMRSLEQDGEQKMKEIEVYNERGIRAKHVIQHIRLLALQMQCRPIWEERPTKKGLDWEESYVHLALHLALTEKDTEGFEEVTNMYKSK